MSEGIVIGNLTIPVIKGDKGDKGNTGEIVSISLVLLSPSSTAYAINNGSTTQAQIELGIPKGLSVSTTNINASGELIFTFNDNSTVNVGQVVGKGISEVTVTEEYDFVVTYTDGTSVTACNLEEEILGAINDILESYYTKTEIDNKGFITKEVNNLTNYTLKTNTGSSIELLINNSTYVMTLNLKNSAGTTISTGTIDLPLETMVVGATYDNTNKKIVLTLKNGSTIDVPVADLVSGLQSEINSNNKLSSDLVDDTNHTNKFVTASEKEQITTNATDISNIKDGTSIDSFGDVETALSGKEDKSNKVTTLSSSSTDTQYPSAKTVYNNFVTRDEEIEKLQTENAQLLADHPDITDTGTDLILNGTGDLEMSVDVGGNSTQETTSTSEGDEYNSPSPEHKQDINNVEGDVVVISKNSDNTKSNTVTFPLSQGQKLMLGDTLEDDGIHHKKQQIVLTGTENDWSFKSDSNAPFRLTINDIKPSTSNDKIPNIKSSHFIPVAWNTSFVNYDSLIAISITFPNIINFRYTDISTLEEFKTWLAQQYANNTPVIVEYELAEEVIDPYTPEQQTAYNKLKEMQSYYDLTYVVGSSDNAQPILTVQAKKSLKVMNDEISNLINRVTILED